MTHSLNFVDLDRNVKEQITLANGPIEKAIEKDTCQITVLNANNEIKVAKLENVLYIPQIDRNIF